MNAPINDGGPAFPTKYPAIDPGSSVFHTEPGMTMRDYFAAQALAGQLAAEGPEYGHMDEYIHPETGAPVIGKNSCFAVTSGDGVKEIYKYDRTKLLAPVLKRSYAQIYAEKSYELADAMLVARERKQHEPNPQPSLP